MVKSGLTEKRMRDRRFRRTEKAILYAVFSVRDYPNASIVAKKARISRSTLYRHHKNTRNIISDYEKYMLKKYSRMVEKWGKNKKLRFYFEQMLVFVVANKKIILFLLKNGRKGILEGMIAKLEPKVVKAARLPKKAKTVLVVYRGEVLGLLEEWGKSGFSDKELNKVLENIIYLTNTIRERLLNLKN